MQIECIALDLDRTTLNREGKLSPGNRQALEYVIRKGIHVVIASGRAFTTLPADVMAVPGIDYAITSNGAAVYHVPSGECLHRFTMIPGSVQHIIRLMAQEDPVYETFIAGHAYAFSDYVRDPVAFGVPAGGIPYIQGTRTPIDDMEAFLLAHDHELDSIDLVVHDQAKKARLWKCLADHEPDIYVTSSVEQLIEISHRDAGKHAGIRFIAQHLGIPLAHVAAFGDGDNDVDMLKAAGCGIAMANASPLCLANADMVTRHHAEDGVAYAIHELLKL